MNKFKHMKKILKQCIYQLDESSSLFVVNPDKDFTRKRKHLFGSTLMNVLLLEGDSGNLKITNLDRLIFTKNSDFTI